MAKLKSVDNAGSWPNHALERFPARMSLLGSFTGSAQFGSSVGTQVGLAVGTDSCNAGIENLNWFCIAK